MTLLYVGSGPVSITKNQERLVKKASLGDLLPMLPCSQLHLPFSQFQRKALRATGAEPEMLNGAFVSHWKAEESPAVQSHQHFGTIRIGALGNH
jgi:hypothetical protein